MEDQKQIQNINIGSKIGLSFDLGKFEHSVYGNADLSGTIPLMLPYGKYIEPTILKESKRLETMITKLIPQFRDLWYNKLDEEVSAQLRHCIILTSCINPIDDIETIDMQVFFYITCICTVGDDIIDDINSYSKDIFKKDFIRNIRKSKPDFLNKVINEDTFNDIEIPIPDLEIIKPYIKKVLKLFESSTHDLNTNNSQHIKEAIYDTFYAVLLNAEHTNDEEQLSQTTKSLFGGYHAGMVGPLEFAAFIRGVNVSNEIRKDILFQRMIIAYAKASHMMNDILGCGRDISLNQVHDSSILSQVVHKGIPLQNVFDQTLSELVDEINDIGILGKILRQYYCDDKDLLEYINCTERMLDGQLYAYKNVPRYGDLNIKIVSNE